MVLSFEFYGKYKHTFTVININYHDHCGNSEEESLVRNTSL